MIVDRVTAYARAVLSGEIVAGRLVRLACQRHLRDLETGPARGLWFDVEAATEAIEFFEEFLCLAGGDFEGRPFLLQPWQAFIVGSLFGWKCEDGSRRFRVAYIEIGKGSGKSPLAAGIGLYMLIADGEARAEVYAAATKKDQAMILFRDAIAMVDQSPALAGRLVKSGAPGREWNLAHLDSGSFFRPISSDDGQSGPRPHCGLIDEVHEHKTPHVVDMMRAGTKGRTQALILEITNSGHDRDSVCWQHHEQSAQVLAGVLPSDSWFAYVCQLDVCEPCREAGKTAPVEGCDACDDWRDPAVWIKANPNLGVSIQPKYLRELVDEARGMPSRQLAVKRLNFCTWTETENKWIGLGLWDACAGAVDAEALRGRPCYGGLDLSSTTDLTSLVLLFPPLEADETIDVLAWFWCPEVGVRMRSEVDRVPYTLWVQQGLIEATPGDVIDYGFIRERARAVAQLYELQETGFDPHNALQLVNDLAGDGLTMAQVPQRFAVLSPATKELERLIRSRRIRHDGHPILRWNVSNAAARQDAQGNVMLVKPNRKARIDGAAAMVDAIDRMTRNAGEHGPSVYEQRGLVRL